MKQGVVSKNMNGYSYVQTPSGEVHECKVRGRLKKRPLLFISRRYGNHYG